jgi:hypothetical protein
MPEGSGIKVGMPRKEQILIEEMRKLTSVLIMMMNKGFSIAAVQNSPVAQRVSRSQSSTNLSEERRSLSQDFLVEETTPPASPLGHGARRETVVECIGCANMGCARQWRTFGDLPPDPVTWMRRHDFFKLPTCADHGESGMRVSGEQAVCQVRTGEAVCRHTAHIYSPYLNSNSKITMEQLFLFWVHVANNESGHSISKIMALNKNTVSVLFDRVGAACHLHNVLHKPVFSHCAVDETYVGKRKYERGKRPRKRGFWFVTVTEIERDGKVGRTSWELVKRRDKATLTGIVEKHLASAKTVVWSDSHKGYKDLGKICRHFAVNHSKEFRTVEGCHTNHAEGVHSVVKRYMLQQHNRFGVNSRLLRKHVALQTSKLLNGNVPSEERWGHRCAALFAICRGHYRSVADTMETISADSDTKPCLTRYRSA